MIGTASRINSLVIATSIGDGYIGQGRDEKILSGDAGILSLGISSV
jgi:hypothetical protein